MGEIFRTERDDRICELSSLHKIGDESHYILECTYFDECPQHMASLFSSRTVFTCVLGAQWSRLIETVPLSAHKMLWLRKSYFGTFI